MQLAFYKASSGNWLDAAIDQLTGGGGFSHVELVFANGDSFSSTSRKELDGGTRDGVRFREGANRIDFASGKWELVDLPFVAGVAETEGNIRYHAGIIASRCEGYDFGAVFRFVVPFVGESADKWMCSEVVAHLLNAWGFLSLDVPAWQVSPNLLYRLVRVNHAAVAQ